MPNDDDLPLRGAGALPYTGVSGGAGDMSGVSFARNLLERPPSPDAKLGQGKFMDKFQQLLDAVNAAASGQLATPEDMAAAGDGEAYTAETELRDTGDGFPDVPEAKQAQPPAPDEARRQRLREQLARGRETRKANIKARKEAKQNGGSVAVQKSQVSVQGKRPTSAEPASVQGRHPGRSVSKDGVSDVPRAGGGEQAQLPQVRAGDGAAGQDNQPRVASPFHVNPRAFQVIPITDAERLLNEMRAQCAAIGALIEQRRLEENQNRTDICTWCKEPFPNGVFFARHPFELEPGSGNWRVLLSCRKGSCLAKQNAAVEKIMNQLREERERV